MFGAFTEGLQLFASFAILLNFPRFSKMKGMGQIISWSVRDETLHCNSIDPPVPHFRCRKTRRSGPRSCSGDLYIACATIVDHEDAFIDLAFEHGRIEGLTAEEVKDYIRFIADRRLQQLGLQPIYHIEKNPLPWMDDMLNGGRARQFLREPRHRILQGLDPRHLGRSVQLALQASADRPLSRHEKRVE